MAGDESSRTLLAMIDGLTQGGSRSLTPDDLKALNATAKTIQSTMAASAARGAVQRKDYIGLIQYFGGLIFLGLAFAGVVWANPPEKRGEISEKLVPVLTLVAGFVFGKAGKKPSDD